MMHTFRSRTLFAALIGLVASSFREPFRDLRAYGQPENFGLNVLPKEGKGTRSAKRLAKKRKAKKKERKRRKNKGAKR